MLQEQRVVELFKTLLSIWDEIYHKYCNLKIIHRRFEPEEQTEVFWLGNREKLPGFIIVLLSVAPEMAPKGSFHHLGFDVPHRELVDHLAEIAKQEGCLVMAPHYISDIVGYICMLQDPDGNMVEISHGQVIDPP